MKVLNKIILIVLSMLAGIGWYNMMRQAGAFQTQEFIQCESIKNGYSK